MGNWTEGALLMGQGIEVGRVLGRRMILVLFMGNLKYLWVTNWGCAGAVGI